MGAQPAEPLPVHDQRLFRAIAPPRAARDRHRGQDDGGAAAVFFQGFVAKHDRDSVC